MDKKNINSPVLGKYSGWGDVLVWKNMHGYPCAATPNELSKVHPDQLDQLRTGKVLSLAVTGFDSASCTNCYGEGCRYCPETDYPLKVDQFPGCQQCGGQGCDWCK